MKRLLLLTCILLVSVAPLAVAQNLVGQWSFEGNLLDSSGNNNNGTATGTVGYAPGRFGQALDFTGGGYVTIPNSPSLQTQNFTVAYWANLSFAQNVTIAAKRNPGDTESAWQVNIAETNWLQGCLFGGPGSNCWYFTSISPSPVGNWTHIAVTYDGTTLYGYVNGNLVLTQATPGYTPGNGTADIILGGGPLVATGYFYGLLDELQIYDGALTAAQVYLLANPISTDKNQCKNGGWQFLMRPDGTVFNNQGLCIQYVNTGH
jgi:Concanavalin A-like lectin/glucanases superfamily